MFVYFHPVLNMCSAKFDLIMVVMAFICSLYLVVNDVPVSPI
jgi:hypothetical protein